ncbi:hypothetical protein KXD40_002702 [Peronospora effusa]|uniref:Uncharacterized protein n=1 Tax=Peronospora effusa TaxID=542832 RepID=A0A3M6VWB4_9STRA|nr:hypothetical protein DD238_002747 [Peronospora effusa]RQM14418.1 hypothetical protein DD237_005421 [Peronospora effusa]UIZ29473.1 hypothetical protein KXD40_002702 [Peronospora effusa]
MGCSQSKSTDVSTDNANALVAKKVDPPTKELETETDLELQIQEEEHADEAPKTLEPIASVIAEQQVPDSAAAVDVPDSVRANFSSFNISFIDPTVSAPTSATTEPNVASIRVAVISGESVNKDKDETLSVEADVQEVETNVAELSVDTNIEDIAAEQVDLEKEQVEEPVATTEEFVATIEMGMEPVEAEVVMEPLAGDIKEEILVEEQIDVKTEEVEVFTVNIGESASIEDESETMNTSEEVEQRTFAEATEPVAATETVAASEEIGATVSITEKVDELTNEDNIAQLVDEEMSADSVVVNVAEPVKEEKVVELIEERSLAQFVVEKTAESIVENVVDLLNETKASEPAKDENKATELVMENEIAEEAMQMVAEPVVDEKSFDVAEEKTDGESVKLAGVNAFGGLAVPGEESDVDDKAIAVVKEPASIIEEPVAVAIRNQTEAVAETRSTVDNKLDGSPTSENGIETEDMAFISDNKEAVELMTKVTTRVEESVASN